MCVGGGRVVVFVLCEKSYFGTCEEEEKERVTLVGVTVTGCKTWFIEWGGVVVIVLIVSGKARGMLSRKNLPLPRQKAPAFVSKAVVKGAIEQVTSEQYLGKWLVLFFYPYDYTFVCPTEVRSE